MGDLFDEPQDATPLDPDERAGLLQGWISFRNELNQAEQANIAAGVAWARRGRRRDLLSEAFLKALHQHMFGEVWQWAGTFRQSERNIGVTPTRIQVDLRNTLNDARHWIEHRSFPVDEIVIRLHHRLVAIHPFPNGNGRCMRLFADLLVVRLGGEPFSWGSKELVSPSETRAWYIAALRAADRHDVRALLVFARS